MTRKGIVRAAWVIAAAFTLTTAPTIAAPSAATAEQDVDAGKPLKLTKSAKPKAKTASRVRKAKVAVHRSSKTRLSQAKEAKAELAASRTLSPGIANAKAEMTSAEARGVAEVSGSDVSTQPAMAAPSSEPATVPDRAVSAPDDDQPRAIQTQLVMNDQPLAALPVTVPEKPREASASGLPQASVTAVSGDAWAQSSLIGKIFIAFGGMLTLASAARMLIA